MRKFIAAAVIASAALATASARAATPLEVYGRAPAVSHVLLSPDGGHIALGSGSEGAWQVEVRTAADQKVVFRSNLGDSVLRGLIWAGPNHLLVITTLVVGSHAAGDPGRPELVVGDLDLDKGSLKPLLFNGLAQLPTVPVGLTVKGKHSFYFVKIYGREGQFGVPAIYKLDYEAKEAFRAFEGYDNTNQFALGRDGEPVARADYNLKSGQWTLVVKTPSGWKTVYTETALVDAPSIVGTAPDGESVYVRAHDANGWAFHQASLKDASWSGPIETTRDAALAFGSPGRMGPGFYQEGVVYDPTTHAVAGVSKDGMERRRYSFLSADDQKAWESIERAFPGQNVTFSSWSDDHSRWVVKVDGKGTPAYYLVDPAKGAGGWIADQYADLPDATVVEQKPISYTAADGLTIPAYLTLPKDRPAKGLPLVVVVHGGEDATPAGRVEPGYHWLTQALAAQGYAVLSPEFRGSTGFGEAFTAAGYGQWGRKQQSDLSDGVKALAARGVIDPARVCILGQGYGGYAALAGAVLQSGVYRCAVAVDAVSDLKAYRSYLADDSRRYYDVGKQRDYDRAIGSSDRMDPVQDAISPALHADRASAPILLIHPENDTIIPYTQSQEMAQALSHAGKPVKLVILKDEDHTLAHTRTRVQALTTAVAFLQANNPTDPAPAKP
jgi:dipeptidyl aminopeptidase/acylaminoacyl peptidase